MTTTLQIVVLVAGMAIWGGAIGAVMEGRIASKSAALGASVALAVTLMGFGLAAIT